MSFSVSLRCACACHTGHDGHSSYIADIGDPTYNIAPMFTKALGCSIRDLNGKTGADVLTQLAAAITDMQRDPAAYEAMNPENGWGSATGALDFLRKLHDACEREPDAQVVVT